MNLDMSEMTVKNIFAYEKFDQQRWNQETKKYGYRYINQVSEAWENEIRAEQFITIGKENLEYMR